MSREFSVVVRGGGDIATGTIHRLYRCGFSVLVLETERPSAIRRYVAFSEAVYEGSWRVEGVEAVHVRNLEEAKQCRSQGKVPVLSDATCSCLKYFRPRVLVDAILAKRNLGTTLDMADTVIALGPGFTAGRDAHFVIETMRGHDLGRVLTEGTAMANTGVPGVIVGYGKERVIHSPADGIMVNCSRIGEIVKKDQVIAYVGQVPVKASLTGVLRGLLRDGYPVTEGFKIADIDPRESEQKNCFTISDKARCIAGGVLEGILSRQKVNSAAEQRLREGV